MRRDTCGTKKQASKEAQRPPAHGCRQQYERQSKWAHHRVCTMPQVRPRIHAHTRTHTDRQTHTQGTCTGPPWLCAESSAAHCQTDGRRRAGAGPGGRDHRFLSKSLETAGCQMLGCSAFIDAAQTREGGQARCVACVASTAPGFTPVRITGQGPRRGA